MTYEIVVLAGLGAPDAGPDAEAQRRHEATLRASTASAFSPWGASVAAICQSRMRFVSAEPVPNVEREKLANHVSASERSERRRAPSGRAVRIPVRRSDFVGPCVSSRSATSAADPRLRHDSLHADDPAVTDECDVHGPGRGLRDGDTRGSGDRGTRRRRRLEIDREQAREGEQEDDEQDPHRAVRVRRALGNACKPGADYRRDRADAHSSRAESGDARATAPPPAAQAVRHAGRRARRRASRRSGRRRRTSVCGLASTGSRPSNSCPRSRGDTS